jgi:hypothetical protein
MEIEPEWGEIFEKIVEHLAAMTGAQLAGMGAAIAAPLGTAVVLAIGWAKAGHEFDDVSNAITGTAMKCRAAVAEALGAPHTAVSIGGMDLAGDVPELALKIRDAVAAQLKIPAAVVAELGKKNSSISNKLYAAAWGAKWPPLKAALLERWTDTFWKTYRFERLWLESFEKGGFAPVTE